MKELSAESSGAAAKILWRCQKDPLFFSTRVLGKGEPWEKQKDIMESVLTNRRTVVPSGYAVGKTWTAARIALWFLYSHPKSIVITTAPTWRQVENVLWAEIRRQHSESVTPLGGEVLRTQIKVADDWFAIGMSTDDPTRFQGFHAAHVLVIFDEAAGVSKGVWDAAEGQMTGAHARWLAIGNPIAPSGSFYDACRSPGWKAIPISCLDTPNVTAGRSVYPSLVTGEWVEDRKREWGEASPLYESRVLGRFPTASEHSLIPLWWVLEANARDEPLRMGVKPRTWGRSIMGVDVARSGADATVLLVRDASYIRALRKRMNLAVTETAGEVVNFAEELRVAWGDIHIDEIGVGAGVADILAEQGRPVRTVNFAARAKNRRRFANMRAECYWKLRDALRPDMEELLAIPAGAYSLCSELTSIEWSVNSRGQVIIEPKENIKQRTGKSPDHADALALTYATRTRPVRMPYREDEPADDRPWLTIDNPEVWTPLRGGAVDDD